MTTIKSFINRLKKIGIQVELFGNYPWIYLNRVNGIKVQGTFQADHGFTVFFIALKPGEAPKMTDISVIFNKIRETINVK